MTNINQPTFVHRNLCLAMDRNASNLRQAQVLLESISAIEEEKVITADNDSIVDLCATESDIVNQAVASVATETDIKASETDDEVDVVSNTLTSERSRYLSE